MDIEQEVHCLGYYGFGSGWAIARSNQSPYHGQPAYCNTCKRNRECWNLHRGRVHQIVSDLSREFDSLAELYGGPIAVNIFKQRHFCYDPYTTSYVINMQSASYYFHNRPLPDAFIEDPLTPVYPFTVN